jgi:8-oxo-dGTP pyrophosphatase MutT (NUDIX family)
MIEQLSSRVVYENAWMRVREDEIARADGSTGIYGVVEKPSFVVVVAIADARIWLVQQYRYPIGERRWELPQGSHEGAARSDPADVARAELAEETGVRAERVELVGSFHVAYGYSNQIAHVFVAGGLTDGPAIGTPEEVDLVASRFTIAEFEAMLATGEISDAATLASWSLLRLRRPELLEPRP